MTSYITKQINTSMILYINHRQVIWIEITEMEHMETRIPVVPFLYKKVCLCWRGVTAMKASQRHGGLTLFSGEHRHEGLTSRDLLFCETSFCVGHRASLNLLFVA